MDLSHAWKLVDCGSPNQLHLTEDAGTVHFYPPVVEPHGDGLLTQFRGKICTCKATLMT
jgi:hypothetical protein